MKLSAPTTPVWGVATGLGVLGLLANLNVISALAKYDFWFAFAAFAVLAIACLFKGV